MKKLSLLLASQILFVGIVSHAEEALFPRGVSSIDVAVQGLRNQTGTVVFCLWREMDAGFPRCDSESPFRKQTASASEPKITFREIEQGTYAISLFHDETESGTIETNFLGMPRSGIGISGTWTTPPTFSKANFSVPTNGPVIIQATYR